MKHRKIECAWAAILLLLFLAGAAFAQAPTASIKIEGYSPKEIHDLGWAGPKSSGLSTVGTGQVVYLVGSEAGGETVTSFDWTLTSRPANSNATLDSTDTWQVTFRPDLVGDYMVQLVITTASGTSDPVPVRITAAKFVGVGGLNGNAPAFPECALCHGGNTTEWSGTGHATIFTLAIDGKVSDHYNESCIECHTTGYDTTATALGNDGFFSVQQELGWVFPATLEDGNWADMQANYPKLANRANIQCESCHGPGSEHRGNVTKISMTLDEAACGQCHEEDPYHRISSQWKNSTHGNPTTDRSGIGSCAPCHSAWGFVTKVDPITNDTRPTTGMNQLSCAGCHDPHSGANEHQLRTVADVTLQNGEVVSQGGNGKFCMQCHQSRRDAETYVQQWSSRFGPHHSPQADMLAGTNAIEFGKNIPSTEHRQYIEQSCVGCHMAPTPAAGQPGSDFLGEHTWAMHWDSGTPDDPSDDVENIAACQTCHGGISSFADIKAKEDYDGDGTIEAAQDEVVGLMDEVGKMLPPIGDPAVALETNPTTNPNYTPVQLMAGYNYLFVLEDQSRGMHNFQYTINLLKTAHEALTTGDIGAGLIGSIADVPNDQGKQVRVAWSRFPGDGVATNPIGNYSLWRRVDDSNGTLAKANPVASRSEMFAQANADNIGKRFTVAQDGVWDFVGWVPAAARSVYSTVVPTLFDSTEAGIYWSYFFIAGHAQNQTFETAPDSGYSVDNLAPSTPSSIAMNVAPASVSFQWDDPIDPDFRYFAIYRAETSGFDPKTTEALATLIDTDYTDEDVEAGKVYYYRFSAFDFAGNESAFSAELTATITSIGENGAVPTEYALLQNYPNPFNPTTTIEYQLPEAGQVRLTLFNVLGNPVRTLVDRFQTAGSFKISWNARDDFGNVVPSGVYFYRVESGDFAEMKKMILMK